MKKGNHKIQQRTRQRQKMSRRTVIVILASCMTCMVIGLTVFFNMSRVDKSLAGDQHNAVSVYMVEDVEPVMEKILDVPVLRQLPVIGPNTVIARRVKVDHNAGQNVHN